MNVRRGLGVVASLLVVFGVLSIGIAEELETSREDRTFYQERETSAPAGVKLQLTKLRAAVREENLTFSTGYTTAMDRPLEKLAGSEEPRNFEALAAETASRYPQFSSKSFSATAKAILKIEGKDKPEEKTAEIPCIAQSKRWDWRRGGKVTAIRDQDGCGSCWIFGCVGAFEASYLIRNNVAIDASEQFILNCSKGGTCNGGFADKALHFLATTGTATETLVPYAAQDNPCDLSVKKPFRADAWGWVDPINTMPSVTAIKEALCRYGPIACSVRATPLMQAYTEGVFNEKAQGPTNHTVCLIGWDDSKEAWIMRNSWGPGWGNKADFGSQRGYMYIRYGSNSIGKFSKWVVANLER